MSDPYKMVIISILAFLTLVIGVLAYKYIYPKKNISLFILLILISLLPLVSLLRIGSYESGDLTQNVFKSMEFYNSIQQGNLIPRWAGNLNATYGYPLFVFVYPLPFYVVFFFHFIGFSFISSIKLLIASSFILSGVGMYFFVKEEFGKFSAFVSGIFYLFAPYHLVDMHFRVSIGELASFALLPFSFLFVHKLLIKKSSIIFILAVISLFLLFLANPAISFICIILIAIYAIFICIQKKERKIIDVIYLIPALLFSLGLSAFYWMPVIFESKFTHQAIYVSQISFVKFQELLYSSWRYGFLFQGPKGELSFLIGYVQILVIALCIYLLIKNQFTKIRKSNVMFYLILLLSLFFLLLPISSFVWDKISILKNFQFTYRLLLFVSFITAVLAGILATKINKKIILFICLLAILQTILNWGNRRTIPQINDSVLSSQLPMSTSAGEGFQPAAPKWIDPDNPWQKNIPNNHLEVLRGKAEITELERISTRHEYRVNVSYISNFKENTLYFPNWQVTANNKILPINFTDPKYPGVITFQLEPGSYKIIVEFKNTIVRNSSNTLSGVSFLILFLYLLSILIRKVNFFSKVLNKLLPSSSKSHF
ncbi:MAG: hypothetical protein HYT08_00925 [Candidatus Levybacteria bacterium]|nr:hypothetical protein [Candidatus Levybacteria bacterium]